MTKFWLLSLPFFLLFVCLGFGKKKRLRSSLNIFDLCPLLRQKALGNNTLLLKCINARWFSQYDLSREFSICPWILLFPAGKELSPFFLLMLEMTLAVYIDGCLHTGWTEFIPFFHTAAPKKTHSALFLYFMWCV